METPINTSFTSLTASPILLPLTCILNSLVSITSIDKAGWKRGGAFEMMRRMVFLAFYIFFATAQFLWEQLPTYKMNCECLGFFLPTNEEQEGTEDTAISRVLSQILELINATPISSEKYEFARTLAEKIIQENMVHGDLASEEANRVALGAGFWTTLKLLVCTLEEAQRQQHDIKGNGWSWCLLQSVFFRRIPSFPHIFSFDNLFHSIGNFLFAPAKSSYEITPSAGVGMSTSGGGAMAEKLALELLWITERLKACSAIEEAIGRWGAQSSLANLSLSAHPRVQASLLRISVLLFKELVLRPDSFNARVKKNLLMLWFPLFCHAKSGFDVPVFTPLEKVEIVGFIEQIVLSLSELEQESVLACWLREYVSSSSEWPNLQECFESWRHATRKAAQL